MYYPCSKNKAVTAKLICVFVFAYADCWFSHEAAHFSVHRMSTVINDLNLQGCEKCSDHSVLVYELDICHTDGVISEQKPTPPKRFHLNEIPGSFLNCEESLPKIMLTIDMIEKLLAEDSDVSTAYQEFVYLIKSEMSSKLKAKRKFQLDEQKRLGEKLLNSDNPTEFWRKIGEIGMANERKPKIPLEVTDDDGNLLTNKTDVIN